MSEASDPVEPETYVIEFTADDLGSLGKFGESFRLQLDEESSNGKTDLPESNGDGPKEIDPVSLSHLGRMMLNRPKLDPRTAGDTISKLASRRHRAQRLSIAKDIIGLLHHAPDGNIKNYSESYSRAKLKGRHEAASYGIGMFGDQRAVIYNMHFEFMGGSLGVVAGEEFQRATDVATRKNLPFVAIIGSGGARQQEQSPALAQLERLVQGLGKFKANTRQPSIAVLAGPVYGGVSASLTPNTNLLIGIRGGDYGFSGGMVIETYEGKKIPDGSQSVEAGLIDRNIDVLAKDPEEAYEYITQFLAAIKLKPNTERSTEVTLPADRSRTVRMGQPGISSLIRPNQEGELIEVEPPEPLPPDATLAQTLMSRLDGFRRSAYRPDAEFIIENTFSDVVPLYNHRIDPSYKARPESLPQHVKLYPAIIAAIGRIGIQPYLIIGQQPSFQKSSSGVAKIPASPTPQDYEYAMRMMEVGERLNLPLVLLTDTLGARPTIKDERRGIPRAIANMMMACNQYKPPEYSVVIGALGSGGGLATAPRGDYRAFTEGSMMYVAAPGSLVAILDGASNPDLERVALTQATMRATAQDQFELGLSDETIKESEDPYITAQNIHEAIDRASKKLSSLSERKRLRKRWLRIREQRVFPLEKSK